jgi:hypothetical protein
MESLDSQGVEHTPEPVFKKGYIRYEQRDSGLYASFYKDCHREGDHVWHDTEYLGKVLDRENGIFSSRSRGIFTFSMKNGYGPSPIGYDYTSNKCININNKTSLVLNFGDIWLYDEILKQSGLSSIIDDAINFNSDLFNTLVAYKLIRKEGAYKYVENWYQRSYAKFLYPEANTSSQRISEFLVNIGDETILRSFFSSYISYILKLNSNDSGIPILIDSTGLPNCIDIDITAINKHNGVINNEIRLIYVVDKNSGMPIYFRYVPGNIIDITTLNNTIKEIKTYGVDVKYLIIDAGYNSEENIRYLFNLNIPFITRMGSNRKIYKELIAEHYHDIQQGKYIVKYQNRVLFAKKVPITIYNNQVFVYIFQDTDRRQIELKKYALQAIEDSENIENIDKKLQFLGMFMLLSSENSLIENVLPLYYTRQRIEQLFDTSKNYADLLPLRIHSEEAFRGHLLISFFASIMYLTINNRLKDSKFSTVGALDAMDALKISIYDDYNIISEQIKVVKDVISTLNLQIPKVDTKIYGLINNSGTSKPSQKKRGRPRKNSKQSVDQPSQPKSQFEAHETPKRKRGRPRKIHQTS